MGEAIGQILPLAVVVAFSPMPIVAVVLMLVSARARVNGPAFVLGWILGVGVVGGIILAVSGPADASDNGQPATWVDWLKLLLGALLVLFAVSQWRGRPAGDDEVPTPRWMGAIDAFTPLKALGSGVALSVANPKNLLVIIGAAAADAETGISGGKQTIVWLVFTAIATVGVAVPVVMYYALGERAAQVLDRLKMWMIRNSSVVMAVLCLIIGVKLIGDAISGFAA
jgi:threonine/homoserine/homoserine lactone efflux protein